MLAEQELYRNYMADMLVCLVQSMPGVGCEKIPRYYDISNQSPQDKRSGEELVADVISRAGLEVI